MSIYRMLVTESMQWWFADSLCNTHRACSAEVHNASCFLQALASRAKSYLQQPTRTAAGPARGSGKLKRTRELPPAPLPSPPRSAAPSTSTALAASEDSDSPSKVSSFREGHMKRHMMSPYALLIGDIQLHVYSGVQKRACTIKSFRVCLAACLLSPSVVSDVDVHMYVLPNAEGDH